MLRNLYQYKDIGILQRPNCILRAPLFSVLVLNVILIDQVKMII